MGVLRYGAITSLDGYIADVDGRFDWAAPDAEVHAFVNDLERDVGTYLYGRRMYDVMAFWEDVPDLAAEPPEMRDYAAIWAGADKVVFSRTLESVRTARTRLEREFDAAAVRELVDRAAAPVSIGGALLASAALRAGLVEDIHLIVVPVVVGGGTPALPRDVRFDVALRAERTFSNGTVHLHYAVRH